MSTRGEKASKPPRSRPASERRARKASALRKRLIDCALSQFEKSGFTRTSIDAITEAADVGKGTFYNYFDSKEALLAAWGRELLNAAAVELSKDTQNTEPALRRLFRLFATLIAPVQDRPRLAAPFVFAHLLLGPETPRKVPLASKETQPLDSPPANVLDLALPIVKLAIEQKSLRSDLDAHRVARALVGVFYHSVMLSATGEDREAPREGLRKSLALALEGLAPVSE